MRILIVEDDTAISCALRTFLRKAGYASDAFGTLSHAWAALELEPFDVVLLDNRGLPDGDGLDLLHRIRNPRSAPTHALPAPDLRVLFLTGQNGRGVRYD